MCRALRGVATNGHVLRADGADGVDAAAIPTRRRDAVVAFQRRDAAATFTAIPARHGLECWR